MIYSLQNKKPNIHDSAYIAQGAHDLGDVTLGNQSGIWINSVVGGGYAPIKQCRKRNIQDKASSHRYAESTLILEDEVSVGHNVILHGCTLKKGALIGMGSTILDGAIIGENALIGANTLIPSGKEIPPRTLVLGSPGKVIRELTDEDLNLIQLTIDTYVKKAKDFKTQLQQLS